MKKAFSLTKMKRSQNDSKQEGGKPPINKKPGGIQVTCKYSPRSLRNNNSSRIWKILQRDDVAKKFQVSVAPSEPIVHSELVHEDKRSMRIPIRKKILVAPRHALKPDGSVIPEPYRVHKRLGYRSLHEPSEESTLGKTAEEIDYFFLNLVHRPAKKAPNHRSKNDPSEKHILTFEIPSPKIEQVTDKNSKRLRKKLRNTSSLDSALICNDSCTSVSPRGPKHSAQTNDSSQNSVRRKTEKDGGEKKKEGKVKKQVESLLRMSSECEKNSLLQARSPYTAKKNYSFQMAELLDGIPRYPPSDMNVNYPRPRRKRAIGPISSTSDFMMRWREKQLINSNLQVENSANKRIVPQMRQLRNNWPNYPPPRTFGKKMKMSPDIVHNQIFSAKENHESTISGKRNIRSHTTCVRMAPIINEPEKKIFRRTKVLAKL